MHKLFEVTVGAVTTEVVAPEESEALRLFRLAHPGDGTTRDCPEVKFLQVLDESTMTAELDLAVDNTTALPGSVSIEALALAEPIKKLLRKASITNALQVVERGVEGLVQEGLTQPQAYKAIYAAENQ